MDTNIDICMIVHNDVVHDSRVRREASSLASVGWNVLVIGMILGNKKEVPLEERVDGYTIKRIKPLYFAKNRLLKIFQLMSMLPKICIELRRSNARIYHGHDFIGVFILLIAGLASRPFVYDSHELFFDRGIDLPFFEKLKPIEKFLAQRAIATITVNESLSTILAKELNIPKPIVLRNFVDLRQSTNKEAIVFNKKGKKILIHSGLIVNGRHLIELVTAMRFLSNDYELVLLGDGPLKETLYAKARQIGIIDRFMVIPPVKVNEVVATLSQAHLGIVLITSQERNFLFSLPNKLLESIAAQLPVITGSNPEIKYLVEKYNIGLICDPITPSNIANIVDIIFRSNNYEKYKANVTKARLELNWEHEEKKLIEIYQKLFSSPVS